MKAASTSLTSRQRANIVLIALFLTILWLPTFDTFFHIDRSTLPKENRVLAQFPEFKSGPGGLKEYIAGLEACFNDHFGWRKQLIHWHRRLSLKLFPDRNGISPDVIVGRNGWLFLNANGAIDDYRGIRRFSSEDLSHWQALLEHRRDWLAQLGIKYLFVVAPNKQSIYSDQLPDWLTKVRPDTRLDQFLAYLHAHSTMEVVDLRPALRTASRIAPTYFKTDNHWNQFGGFAAYQEIVKNLSQQLPGLEPLSLASFNLETNLTPSSDLADWADLDVNETCALFLTPKSGLPVLEMSPFDEYSTSFSGFTKNPRAQGSAVVFGDSFSCCVLPFLGYHFGRVVFHRQLALAEQWIKREKPDVVISIMVEEQFDVNDPNGLDDPGDYLLRPHRYSTRPK